MLMPPLLQVGGVFAGGRIRWLPPLPGRPGRSSVSPGRELPIPVIPAGQRLVSPPDGLADWADLFGINPSATVETSMDAEVFRPREQYGVGPFPGTRPPVAA